MNVVMTAAAASSKCRARPKARRSRAPRWTRCWRWPTRASANWCWRSARRWRAGLNRHAALVLASNNAKKLASCRRCWRAAVQLVTQGSLGMPKPTSRTHLHRERAGQGAARGAASGAAGAGRRLGPVRGRAGRRAGRDLGALRAEVAGGAGRPRARCAACRTPPTTPCCCSACRVADRRAHFVSTLVAVRHADDPEPLVACGRWPGEILDRAARRRRLRLRPADVHPRAGRHRGRTAAEVKNRTATARWRRRRCASMRDCAWGLG
jgi:XTP/dITP diphosphohydrolase